MEECVKLFEHFIFKGLSRVNVYNILKISFSRFLAGECVKFLKILFSGFLAGVCVKLFEHFIFGVYRG